MEEKIRVLGIAPYEGMCTAMKNVAEDHPQLHLDAFVGDLDAGVELVRRYEPEGYDVIVSRGGTAEMIARITELPVVSIPISVYDILRAIKMAENYSKLYAIVGFPTITEPAHTLCDRSITAWTSSPSTSRRRCPSRWSGFGRAVTT